MNRAIAELWTLGEGTMGSGDGAGTSLITPGFNPNSKRFVGTFIASMMTHLWPYNGTLDVASRVLTLDSEGPSFAGDGMMAKYQDMIAIVDDNHFILSSQVLQADGTWQNFMTAHYHRAAPGKKST